MSINLLFLVPYVPTPIRVRSYNLIRALAHQGHRVTLATLWESEEERAFLPQLEAEGIRVIAQRLTRNRRLSNALAALPTRLPLQARYCWQPDLAAAVAAELDTGRYQVLHVEHLRGAIYAQHLQAHLRARNASIPVVWDSVDCISYLFAQAAQQSRSRKGRLMTRLELPRTRRHEAELVQQFDAVLVTSRKDREAFADLLGQSDLLVHDSPTNPVRNLNKTLHVLPNGVDTDFFAPLTAYCKPNSIVVSGKMSYHANVTMVMHLVQDIMPRVWQQCPEAQLWVVGKDPPSSISRLDPSWSPNRAAPLMGDSGERIVVTGTVPDLRPYLQQAAVAVAPVPYGAGVQNKVLEAMACGRAVVASPQAVAALDVTPGEHLLVADDAESFADDVLELLANPEQRDLMGRSARKYVQEKFSWTASALMLEQIYELAHQHAKTLS